MIFLFRQCLSFVAKLYLSFHFPRLEAIKSISVPRLSGNYLNKRFCFKTFSCFGKSWKTNTNRPYFGRGPGYPYYGRGEAKNKPKKPSAKSMDFFPSHIFTFHSLVQLLLPTVKLNGVSQQISTEYKMVHGLIEAVFTT